MGFAEVVGQAQSTPESTQKEAPRQDDPYENYPEPEPRHDAPEDTEDFGEEPEETEEPAEEPMEAPPLPPEDIDEKKEE